MIREAEHPGLTWWADRRVQRTCGSLSSLRPDCDVPVVPVINSIAPPEPWERPCGIPYVVPPESATCVPADLHVIILVPAQVTDGLPIENRIIAWSALVTISGLEQNGWAIPHLRCWRGGRCRLRSRSRCGTDPG